MRNLVSPGYFLECFHDLMTIVNDSDILILDLIVDTFFKITFPYIWSPVWIAPSSIKLDDANFGCKPLEPPFATSPYTWLRGLYDFSANVPCQPFEFKWINDLGSQLLTDIQANVGGITIQQFSGQYLTNVVKRDYSTAKRSLFNRMTGNDFQMNNPAGLEKNNNNYLCYHRDIFRLF